MRERNVTGFLSELLPEELTSGISNNDLEYFCDRSLFLPPCLENEKVSNSPTYETVIVKKSDKTSGNTTGSGSKLRRVLPIIEQTEGFQAIDFSNDTDFSLFNEDCNKSKAVYNLLHYPQLNLFFKLHRSSLAILNKEHPLDSPLRNFLADYSLFEFESKDKLKQPSVRAQTLELLSKNKKETKGIPEEVLSQFGTSALLPKLEHRLGFTDVRDQGDRLDYLHRITTWESLKKSNVHLKKSSYAPITNEMNDCCVDIYLHPACSSALESLFREKIEFADTVFFSPTFAQKVLSLPNSAGVTHLFKELMEYDADKWINVCEKAISSSNALRLTELLYFSCLLAKDESTQKRCILLATVFYDKLLSKSLGFHHKVNAFKAKLKLLNPTNKLSTKDFPNWETQLQTFLQEVYLVSEQELFMPDFRNNAQDFIDQFIQLFFQSPKDSEKNKRDWATLFSATDRIEEGLEIMQNLMAKGRISFAYLLHYICITFCSTNNVQDVLPLINQFEKQLSSFKPFNFWSRLYKLVISSLKRDMQPIFDTTEELLTEHKHISNTTPITCPTPLLFLHLGKALQSQEIEDKALSLGNNHFFTFINSQDFGETPTIPAKDRSTLRKGVSEFISDPPQMLLT